MAINDIEANCFNYLLLPIHRDTLQGRLIGCLCSMYRAPITEKETRMCISEWNVKGMSSGKLVYLGFMIVANRCGLQVRVRKRQ